MYNRALNAVILGYVINLLLVAISAALVVAGNKAGVFCGALAVASFASAYFSESALSVLSEADSASPEYRSLYRIFSLAHRIPAITTAGGYLIAFIILIGA